MPSPIPVVLVPHDADWARQAARDADRLRRLVLSVVGVHHIGSTAIPGILAKPILDLMPVVSSLAVPDGQRKTIEALGYEWHGPFGLEGRRYCTLHDPIADRRLVQLHFYEVGDAAVDRHLAFRDHLRRSPDLAKEYEREKMRCAALHPENSHAYSQAKQIWIDRIEAMALAIL